MLQLTSNGVRQGLVGVGSEGGGGCGGCGCGTEAEVGGVK